MSSGMNTEQAKEYAKTMTYREAVSNVRFSKGIKYRKATMIKLRELAIIADRLDRKTEPQTNCNGCKFVGTYDTEFPCANCSRKTKDYYAKDEPQTVLEAVLGRQTDEDRRKMAESVRKAIKDEPQACSVNGRPYDCGNCEYHKCTADELQTERRK